ncbi:hypothetical protein [Rariglobus hedericola]|uniref:DUF3592 domain-containing protein n=1 Tax=Rariglobus hedericola TaxID=2597822 RepID=A0A556QRG9_9BACT|nr:hypothetical protein [Rariglobus hedericola]TSJ79236.1 hypothetical protein FPL22_08070 [Rariglobus hedericola]
MILIIVGGFVALIGSLFVYFSWHVTIRESKYRPATFIVERAEYYKARRGFEYNAYGTVDGSSEILPLSDFAPPPNSDTELLTTFPKGRKLEILFDSGAPKGFVLEGTSLRLLPASYNIHNALKKALLKMAGIYGPFTLGLCMHFFITRREKIELKQKRDLYEAKRDAKKQRRALLTPGRRFKKR